MDRLAAMEILIAVIDEGSMSRGAGRFGKPANAATRAVDLLERETGEALLIRSTRRLGLTTAGQRWLGVWREVLAQLATARGTVGSSDALVLTAPEVFGRTWVQPLLEDFIAKNSSVDARLILINRVVDLIKEDIDMAFRAGSLPNNGSAATKLGVVRHLVCASPGYLQSVRVPGVPADLKDHRCIGSGCEIGTELWRFASHPGGRSASISIEPRLVVNSTASTIDAALRGAGVARLLSCQVIEEIRSGRLIPLLGAFDPGPVPVYLAFRGRPPREGAARLFTDLAVPALRKRLRETEKYISENFETAT